MDEKGLYTFSEDAATEELEVRKVIQRGTGQSIWVREEPLS